MVGCFSFGLFKATYTSQLLLAFLINMPAGSMFSSCAGPYIRTDTKEMLAPSFCQKQDQGVQMHLGILVPKAGLGWVDVQ